MHDVVAERWPGCRTRSSPRRPGASSEVSLEGERCRRGRPRPRLSLPPPPPRSPSVSSWSVVVRGRSSSSSSAAGREPNAARASDASSRVELLHRQAPFSGLANSIATIGRLGYSPVKCRLAAARRTRVTPSRRSSVAIESAIPWRSSWRWSASVLSRLCADELLGHPHVVRRLGGELLGLRARLGEQLARRATTFDTSPSSSACVGGDQRVVEQQLDRLRPGPTTRGRK